MARAPYIAQMGEDHPFTLQIEPQSAHARGYRWRILQNGDHCESSTISYATKREAKMAGEKAMRSITGKWRRLFEGGDPFD
jgi:hypothetical protein